VRFLDDGWKIRFGEVQITDDKTNQQYTLVVGIMEDGSEANKGSLLYLRLYDNKDELIVGTWVASFKERLKGLQTLNRSIHPSNNVIEKCIKCAERMEQMKVFI
jgi:hypothetical protein